jgi:hypothetical protein
MVGRDYDFSLGGKGFMLTRAQGYLGRAWQRSGVSDEPTRRSTADTRYGKLDDKVDHPEVWEDWSAGYGEAYRRPERPNGLHWSRNIDSRFPRQLVHCQQLQTLPSRYTPANADARYVYDVPVPSLSNPPVGAGSVLVTGKGYVAALTPTGLQAAGSAFDYSLEATGTTYCGRPAMFGSFTYLGVESGNFQRRGHNAEMTVSGLPGQGFVCAGNKLWRRHSGHLVQSVADTAGSVVLTGTAWSATLSIGNGHMAMSDMLELADQVYCGLPDGIYAGDASGTFFNVLAELRNQRHPDNCRDLSCYNNGVLAPHVSGLYWYHPSEFAAEAREVGPVGRSSNKSPIKGRIRCVTSFGPWLYAGLWTGSQSYILAGAELSAGLPYVWHVMQELPHHTKVSGIHFDGITVASGGVSEIASRMWVMTEKPSAAEGTAPLYWCPVPRVTDNPLNADPAFTANYCGSARFDLESSDWGSPVTTKLYRQVEIRADNLLSGVRYADVYYSVDEGRRTYLGRAQESPKSVLYFPFGSDVFVTGRQLALSFESFTASFNTSPVYRSIVVRGNLRPETVDTLTAVVRIADGVRDRSGKIMRPGSVMISELREMATSDLPQLLIDLAGAASWVVVVPPVAEAEAYQQGEQYPEVVATVQMAVLDMTVNPASQIMAIEDWV